MAMVRALHLCLLMSILLVQEIKARSSGAPSGACDTFIPAGHGVDTQDLASSPYTIEVSKTDYTADETIQVTLRSTDSSNIKGFLIIARTVDHSENDIDASGVGSFERVTDTQQLCGNKALTHSTPLTTTSLVLQWNAPSATVGNIVFQATVVQERVIFWTGILSDQLTGDESATADPDATDAPTTSTTAAPNVDFEVDLSGCGSSKGCFRRPSGCTGDDCSVAASWSRPDGADYVEIELVGQQDGWMALGFSEDGVMENDYVVRCIRDGDSVNVENSMNVAGSKFNDVFDDKSLGLSEQKTSYSNGVLKCSFRRDISLPSSRRKRQSDGDSEFFFNVDQPYTLLLGFGPQSGGFLNQHVETPVVTSEKITVTTDTADVGADLTLLKVHGILMILAWIILIDISLLIARFYKDAWPEKKIAKKQPWFPVHVFMNITALLLTIVAFIIIFVKIGGYSQFSEDAKTSNKAHPVIGIIVTALAVMNPIMAIFRCAPDDPKRAIFNWFHWAVGMAAQILAIINVFFGIGLGRSASFTPDWVLWVLVGFVVFHGLMHITLEVHKCYMCKRDKASDKEMEMTAAGTKSDDQKVDPSQKGLTFKYAVLTLYIMASLGCGLAVIIGMALKE